MVTCFTESNKIYFKNAVMPDSAVCTSNRPYIVVVGVLPPLDVRQLFICHKEVFYRAYAKWPEEKKAYVVDFLDREYQVDKAGTRASLFGHEAEMTEAGYAAQPDLISRVGPWGAVGGRRS